MDLIQSWIDRSSDLLRAFTVFRFPLACLAVVTLMQVGEQTLAQAGLCQSYEAAYNLEALMRDGLTQSSQERDQRWLFRWLQGLLFRQT